MPSGVYQRKKTPLSKRLIKMETIVRSVKKIKFKDLCFEMFGGTRDTDVCKTRNIIQQLRRELLKKDELFYSIGGYHQIIEKPENFVELMNESKKRTKHNMQAINRNVHIGLGQFPETKAAVLKTKSEMKYLLDNGNAND